MLRFGTTDLTASRDAVLSPDGRYVACDVSLELMFTVDMVRSYPRGLAIVDLTTGRATRYDNVVGTGGSGTVHPVVWSPDGRSLVVWHEPATESNLDWGSAPWPTGTLWLFDIASGKSTKLLDLTGGAERGAPFAAFAPDGRRVAVEVGRSIVVVDTATRATGTVVQLRAAERFAGNGAWAPDGRRIALLTYPDCTGSSCTDKQKTRLRLGFVDVTTGVATPAEGYDEIAGTGARVAGWRTDGTAVVVRYQVVAGSSSNC